MIAPPGDTLVLDFKVSLSPPSGGSVVLDFNSDPLALVGIGAISPGSVGLVTVAQQAMVRPVGWRDSTFPVWPLKTPTVERVALKISAQGFAASVVPQPTYVSWRRYLGPSAILADVNIPLPGVRLLGGYQPAPGSNIILNFSEALAPPPGGSIVLEFGAAALTGVLGVTAGSQLSLGLPTVFRPDQLSPSGFDTLSLGVPLVQGSVRYINLSVGIAPPTSQVPNPTATKQAVAILPLGLASLAYGTQKIYNLRQYQQLSGWSSMGLGSPFVSGGVKTVSPNGIFSQAFGGITVYDPHATRTLHPSGFTDWGAGVPKVYPHRIFTVGFTGAIGVPDVHRSPSPIGFTALRFGQAWIYHHTQNIWHIGFESFDTGYPKVRDKARKILFATIPVTTVFGDIRARNSNSKIFPDGFDALEATPWAEVRNTRRSISPRSIDPGALGLGDVANKTPQIYASGLLASAFGAPDVGTYLRNVRPSGVPVPFPGFGAPTFWQTPSIKPFGIAAPGVNGPDVDHKNRTIYPIGRPFGFVGGLEINFSVRYVRLEGSGIGYPASGSPRVEHSIRRLLLLGDGHSDLGSPWVSVAIRYVEPVGISRVEMVPHQVGGLRFLGAAGFIASKFGSRIVPESQELKPLGFRENFGDTKVQNRKNYLRPPSILTYQQPYQRWGTAYIWNSRQYVVVDADYQNGLNPPAWSLWTAIANRNRIIGTLGQSASSVPSPQIDNNARPIYPAGIQAPSLPPYQKQGMVSHYIRNIPLEGIEPKYISGWSNVWNSGKPILPAGSIHSLWGTPSVKNTRRYFKFLGFDSFEPGTSMISYRIRTVNIEPRYTIAPSRIELPTVDLYSRYIEALGIDHPEVGRASLTIHFNMIKPKWSLRNFVGDPSLRNVTPELRTRGRASEEFGDTAVRLEWRPVDAIGSETVQWGRSRISDSRQFMQVAGINTLRMGPKTTLVKTGDGLLSTQWIVLDSVDPDDPENGGNGIPIPEFQIGRPILNQQVVYQYNTGEMLRIGMASLTANSIRVEPGYQELTVAEPFISMKIRGISVNSLGDSAAVGRPRLTPHRIYAVVEASEQARHNHPSGSLHLVDSEAVFGSPRLSRQSEGVYVRSFNSSGMSEPVVFNRRQTVEVFGNKMQRFGWPVVPGDTLVELYSGIEIEGLGIPALSRPPYVGPLFVRPSGIAANAFGALNIEHFNRNIFPQGNDLSLMGRSSYPGSGNIPYQWNHLHVGFPMPTIPAGFDVSVFGLTWISLWIRGVEPVGFDCSVMEYDYQQFDKRMRITRASSGKPAAHSLSPAGFRSSGFGVPNVRVGRQYIRPDGNSDQHRKGAW